MLHILVRILSNEPWFDWSSLPEPGSWWGDLLKNLREMVIPALGFASPGALGWLGYAFFAGKPLLFGACLFGVTGGIFLYGMLTFVDMWRAAWSTWRRERSQKEKLTIGPPF